VRADVVEALAQSMRDVGLINPITLRPREGLGFYLIAGRHRYEAARKLKWEGIPAIVFEGIDADDAELREIDENLIRAELTPAEQAAHHARRKELYEQRHSQSKGSRRDGRGGRKKNDPQNADHSKTYAEDAAAKIGKSRDTVERAVSRGSEIPDVASLAGTSLDKGAELDALAKLAPERQSEVIEKAKAGEKISAKAELKKEGRVSLDRPFFGTSICEHRASTVFACSKVAGGWAPLKRCVENPQLLIFIPVKIVFECHENGYAGVRKSNVRADRQGKLGACRDALTACIFPEENPPSGHADGHAKGHADGHAKGHADGHAKGHAIRHSIDHANVANMIYISII
jgi:ParB-like chromosome segregation protein Spo0J